ncbi:MAG: serine/threonine-protein kinase [Bacteroidota bacterium]
MDPAWTEIKAGLAEALDRPPPDRAAYLDTLDPAVRAEVQALLREEQSDGLLERPLTTGAFVGGLAHELEDEPGPLEGHRVGPYLVQERVGLGGMGDVYRARRADGLFDREVALKVVRSGADTEAVLQRFAAERLILGRLRHPGIARLLDAGIEDDRPWLAMDFVEGQPITEGTTALTIRERVELLVGVAEAVHTAHQSLVVHRDLKPSNVLVSRDSSGRPRAMLLDFGIAKILDPETDPDLTVVDGRRPMTRTYAAPEQVRGEPPTTATDVYGLGLLLYEVLSSTRPFPDEGSRTQLEGAILNDDPPPPSTAAPLDRDLDTICLKALRKEPTERYASAEAFATDLRRWLADEPITARPPSARYRTRKFISRHRVGVAAALGAVIVGIGLTAVYATSLARERDRARTEAESAAQVAELMTEMFDRDPFAGDAERLDSMTVRTFLVQRGAEAVDGLADQPVLQARMATLLSHLYGQLGDYDRAFTYAERSVALHDSLRLATAQTGEAHSALGNAYNFRGEYAEAEAQYRRALALAEVTHETGHPNIAQAVNNLAYVLPDVDRENAIIEAISLGRRALSLYINAFGEDHLDVAQAHNNLGAYLYSNDQNEEAATHYARALAIREESLGDHPLVANTQSNLANLLHEQGDAEGAIPLFEAAIQTYRELLGAEHPSVSTALYGMGEALEDLGRLSDAEAALLGSLAIDRATLPAGHPYIADGLVSIGQLRLKAGRFSEAEVPLREAVAIHRQREGYENDRATAETALGKCLLELGRRGEAIPFFRAALPHLEGEEQMEVRSLLARLDA